MQKSAHKHQQKTLQIPENMKTKTTIIIDLVFRVILQCRRQTELFQQTSHVIGLKANIYFL